MKRCNCNGDKFYGYALCLFRAIFDGAQDRYGALYEFIETREKPEGPFTCINCETEYDTWDDIPESV